MSKQSDLTAKRAITSARDAISFIECEDYANAEILLKQALSRVQMAQRQA